MTTTSERPELPPRGYMEAYLIADTAMWHRDRREFPPGLSTGEFINLVIQKVHRMDDDELQLEFSSGHHDFDERVTLIPRVCRGCWCTDDAGCTPTCYWVPGKGNLCSACKAKGVE